MRALVIAAIVEVCGVDETSLRDDAGLGDLGIDSLDLLEVAMIVEEKSGVLVQAEAFEGVDTLGEAVEVFCRLENDAL